MSLNRSSTCRATGDEDREGFSNHAAGWEHVFERCSLSGDSIQQRTVEQGANTHAQR